MNTIRCAATVLLLTSISCSQRSETIPVVSLDPVRVFDQAKDDSVYFKNLGNIRFDNRSGRLYYTDWYNSRFAVFDADLDYIGEFGSPGQGPGEFLNPIGISFLRDGRYVVTDGNNMRLQILDSDFTCLGIANQIRSTRFGSCAQANSRDEIYVNTWNDTTLFTVYDSGLQPLRSFGAIVRDPNSYYQSQLNITKFVIDEEDQLYCAFFNLPFIRKYDAHDSLVFEISIAGLPEIKERTAEAGETRRKYPNAQYVANNFINDISCDKQYIYVVLAKFAFINSIYLFDKVDGHIIAKLQLMYNNELYKTVSIACTSPQYIYATDFLSTTLLKFAKKDLEF